MNLDELLRNINSNTATSAQTRTPNQQMWWNGGNVVGPAPKTNPIRQAVGNFVEGVGDVIPGKEGYFSEWVAGGPTKHTGYSYASDGTLVNDSTGERLASPTAPGNGGGGAGGGYIPTGGNTGNPTGTPAGSGETLEDIFQRQLRIARDEARRQAGVGFDRAKGIHDEGMALLGKRRGEFQTLFDQGRENILDRYEGERGNLQAANEGASTRMANALRALGLGGSAFIKSEGRQRQDAAKSLGTLQTQRNTNENANKSEFDSRQDWANSQESALSRSLGDASEARTRAETSSDINYLSDMGNLFNTILNNQMAVKAAAGNFTANPYAVNIADMTKSLNGALPSLTGGAGTVQDVSLQEQDPTLALLKKRSGVAGAGLYA